MSKYQTPCRYDFVGSFLRPEEVKKAKQKRIRSLIKQLQKL